MGGKEGFEEMRLTCVTATFNCIKAGNRERLIRCVESVAKLKTEHEHLIYDGASKDGTVELLRELEVTIPSLKVVSEPDTGIYNALNKGVRDARGDWFYVLGCDDYISHPTVLDRILAHEATDTQVIVAEVERNGGYGFFHSMREFENIFHHVPCSHQGIVMRTDVIRHFGGFNEREYKICADWELMHKCHDAGLKHHFVFEPFAFYASGGTSEDPQGPGLTEMRQVIERQLGLVGANAERFWRKGRPSLPTIFRLLTHRDATYRLAGKKFTRRLVKNGLRIALYPLVVATRPYRRKR